jgi:hypothetical protein
MSGSFSVLWSKVRRDSRVRGSALIDRLLFLLHIDPTSSVRTGAIFYVSELLPARAGRLAKWVTRTDGSPVVLLCHRDGFVPAFVGAGFERVILFRNAWHLRRLLRAMPAPRLIHGFAPKSRYPDVARLALPHVPYIHDLQDTLVVYYGTKPNKRWLIEELPHERACMAGADAVIAHSLEPNEGFRRYGIARKDRPRTLFFPLYCDDDAFVDNVQKISDTEIHLVYAGGVAGSHRDPKHYGNIQFFGLIDTLTSQGLHFHIYPSPTNIKADWEEYQALAKREPRFHFHEPVAQAKLAGEVAKYHFGLLPFFRELSEQSEAKLKYATTLKLFNYYEAGLPVIVSKDLFYQGWMVERYNAGFSVRRDELKDLSVRIRSWTTTDVRPVRKALGLAQQTPRLLELYRTISA